MKRKLEIIKGTTTKEDPNLRYPAARYHDDDGNPMVKIRIPGETPWATYLGGDNYRLENKPLHPDYNHSDIVIAKVKEEGGLPTVDSRDPRGDPEYEAKMRAVFDKATPVDQS